MCVVQDRHARRFVNATALHANETILDHVDAANSIASTDLIQRLNSFERCDLLAVDRNRNSCLERDGDFLTLVRSVLWRDAHAKVN